MGTLFNEECFIMWRNEKNKQTWWVYHQIMGIKSIQENLFEFYAVGTIICSLVVKFHDYNSLLGR